MTTDPTVHIFPVYALQVVSSDGNCFFRAVGQQLSMHHTELRERTCDYIESHDDVFRPFVEDEDETLEE